VTRDQAVEFLKSVMERAGEIARDSWSPNRAPLFASNKGTRHYGAAAAIVLSCREFDPDAKRILLAPYLIVAANKVIRSTTGFRSLYKFNDSPGRAKAEVVEMLQATAASL